uniref:F-box/LRR-repeat protein 15/At3g58940/PEG3-like LRR domain-containing protein n=1 Tax=Arundo donax TaxID=35708 RepID=A0A0A9SWH1_ARUDO
MPPGPKPSPPGGATSGTPPPSTSTALASPPPPTRSSPAMKRPSPASSPASSPPIGAPATASASPLVTSTTVDAWLRSSALDNLEELDFCDNRIYGPVMLQPPPPPGSIFRFSSCLRVATVSQCYLPDGIAQSLPFPQLNKLALQQVSISEGSLHSMITGCPVLECLLLNKSFGFCCVRINSASLRSIGVGAQYNQEVTSLVELIIEDAPCLERFLYLR